MIKQRNEIEIRRKKENSARRDACVCNMIISMAGQD